MNSVRGQRQPQYKHRAGTGGQVTFNLSWLAFYYAAVLVELVFSTIKMMRARFRDLARYVMNPGGKLLLKSVADQMQTHRTLLKKLPNHLSVILSNEVARFEDLRNLIYWSMATGVQYVSVYDPKGGCTISIIIGLKGKACDRKAASVKHNNREFHYECQNIGDVFISISSHLL